MNLVALLLPQEALPVALVVAGIAMILGARRLAGGIIVMVLLAAVLPPFLEPLLSALPFWMLLVLLLYFGLVVLQTLLVTLFGKRGGNNAFGHFLGELLVNLFALPFRTLRWSLQGIAWVIRTLV